VTDFSTVACAEEHLTRRENYDVEAGIAASVTLRCAYANRHALAQDLLVNRRAWPFGGFAFPPRASSCAILPNASSQYTQDGQAAAYNQDALVDVAYTVNKGGEDEDLVSESLEVAVEFITQSHKKFSWGNAAGDPLLENEAPGKQRHGIKLVRTLYQVPEPIPSSILDLVGQVNDDDYVSPLLGLTFPEETLLFTLPGLSRTIRMDGSSGVNVTLGLEYMKDGWNKHWRAKTGLFESIFNKDLNQVHKNYPPADFSDWVF
jgi:hypothetical protein